jgi:cell division protein FtsQ
MSGPGRQSWRLVRASTDAVPGWVRRFFQARRRRRLPVRTVATVAAVVVMVLAAGWVLWGTSVVGVREVRVTGTELLSAAQVREVAAIPEQTPLLRVSTGEVADRVAALPPVARVDVRRDWPRAVVIEVVERTAVAAVPTGGGAFAVVDATGVVFQTVAEAGDLPVVIVAEPGPDDPATGAALTVLTALTPELRADLESLTAAGPASIELALRSGWTVVWGDETDSDAKAQVATALLDRDGAVIDVSAPEVVSIR